MSSSLIKKRNFYIPYIKGFAIIAIILIHLIDWSNIYVSQTASILKEILYPGVLFFIATAGSVIYIAYGHYDTLTKPTLKLFRRGAELIGIYFLYNIVKFLIFDFNQEPFYQKFQEFGTFSLNGIFTLQSFSVPITILFTIGVLLILGPILLFINKRLPYPKAFVGSLIILLICINWFLPHLQGGVLDFLYANNNVTFPILFWVVPFIIGFFVASFGFEKYKGKFLILFFSLSIFAYQFIPPGDNFWRPSWNMYPLTLFYIFSSFTFMYLLIFAFTFLEKTSNNFLLKTLSMIRFLGDNTLSIYIYHWIIVDLTLLFFYPKAWVVLITIPIFFVVFILLKKNTLTQYFENEL